MLSHYKQSGVFCIVCLAVLMPWSGRPAGSKHEHACFSGHRRSRSRYGRIFPGVGTDVPKHAEIHRLRPEHQEAAFGWVQEECTPELYPAAKGEYQGLVAEMERLNVTAVCLAIPRVCRSGETRRRARVIPGTSFNEGMEPGKRVALDELRKDFKTDGFKVMGEIGLQYEGVSPSDPSVDQYFALAEELDIPVAIHMGTGGSGRANIACPISRLDGESAAAGRSAGRHPKLRVQVMHAGYPMIDNMLTLLQANSHVYVDVAGLIWSYPIKEVNRYIERLVDAGFEDRVMFGTDQIRVAEADGLLDQHYPERGLPDAGAETRHPL